MKTSLKVLQVLLIVMLLFLVRFIIISEPHYHQNYFIYYAPITNQPSCVVGAFCMYAKEALNKEITPYFLETNPATSQMSNVRGVKIKNIESLWNKVFVTNQLKCVYTHWDTNSYTNKLYYNIPYFWVGITKILKQIT